MAKFEPTNVIQPGVFMAIQKQKSPASGPRPLNVLLQEAFGDPQTRDENLSGALTHEPPPFEKTFIARRPLPKPTADGSFDFDEELPEEDREIRRSVRKRIATSGTHVLAFYIPYLNTYSHQWGIYFDVVAMDVFATDLFHLAFRLDTNVTFPQAVKFAYEVVMFHEMEHFAQEVILADSVRANRVSRADAISNWSATFLSAQQGRHSGSPYREIMATRNEMTEGLQSVRGIEKGALLALKVAYREMSQPHPYNLWNSTSIQSIARDVDLHLGHGLSEVATEELRKLAHAKKSSKVPVFYFYETSQFAGLSSSTMRAMSKISCRRLQSLLTKTEVLEKLRMGVRKKTKHDLVFVFETAIRSIPLDCHALKNEPVSNRILRQFSSSTGFSSTSAFVEFLLS